MLTASTGKIPNTHMPHAMHHISDITLYALAGVQKGKVKFQSFSVLKKVLKSFFV